MHFIAPAILFGLFSTATAAPSVDQAGHASVQSPNSFFAGSSSSACYCCPSIAGASGANCSPAKEDGRCSNNDVLICCDTREQVTINLVEYNLRYKMCSSQSLGM